MKVNGEAIYGTKPHKNTRQWSAGEVPKAEYNKEYEAAYDVTQLTRKQPAGKASIEAFFTAKGNDLYAILPRWPESKQLTLKDVGPAKEVSLLGSATTLRWKPAGRGNITLDVPVIPENLLQQPAWVIRVRR